MKINEIVRSVLENTMTQAGKKYTQTLLANELTEKYGQKVSTAMISDRLKNESMKTNTVIEMLDILGYEMVIRPKNDNRASYVVERGEKRDK